MLLLESSPVAVAIECQSRVRSYYCTVPTCLTMYLGALHPGGICGPSLLPDLSFGPTRQPSRNPGSPGLGVEMSPPIIRLSTCLPKPWVPP